jgi:hypothetical protein
MGNLPLTQFPNHDQETFESSQEENQPPQRVQEILDSNPAMSLIKHPSRILTVGKSQSGKTTKAMELIEYLIPQVDEVIVCSPTYNFQPTWNPIRSKVSFEHSSLDVVLTYIAKLIDKSQASTDKEVGEKMDKRRLVILDDVSFEKSLNLGNKGLFNGLCYNAVWWNMTLVTIVHKMSNVGAGMKENLEYLLAFNSVNKKEMEKLYDHFGFTKTKKDMENLFETQIHQTIKSGKDKYPFFFYNLKDGGKLYYKFDEELLLN